MLDGAAGQSSGMGSCDEVLAGEINEHMSVLVLYTGVQTHQRNVYVYFVHQS